MGCFRSRVGLPLSTYFSGPKIKWLVETVDGLDSAMEKGAVMFGNMDAWLIWWLSGGPDGGLHVTDVSNGSRTMLMNIETLKWDTEMLAAMDIPEKILPEIHSSSEVYGYTTPEGVFGEKIPLAGILGDQQAALFGQACFGVGDAKCTFGTGSFILMNTGPEKLLSRTGLLTTIAWQLPGQSKPVYALEGGAFVCGAAVQWLRDGLKMIPRAADVETLAATVPDSAGVEFVPALTGLGAPHWAPDARGTLTGLTRGTGRGHIARATLDAMALQNADILRAMESDLGKRMKPLRVDGGAAANNLLMQIQADVLGRRLIRPQVIETTVAGACYLAGLGVGLWDSQAAVKKIWRAEREFSVQMSAAKRRKRLASWSEAIGRTLL